MYRIKTRQLRAAIPADGAYVGNVRRAAKVCFNGCVGNVVARRRAATAAKRVKQPQPMANLMNGRFPSVQRAAAPWSGIRAHRAAIQKELEGIAVDCGCHARERANTIIGLFGRIVQIEGAVVALPKFAPEKRSGIDAIVGWEAGHISADSFESKLERRAVEPRVEHLHLHIYDSILEYRLDV